MKKLFVLFILLFVACEEEYLLVSTATQLNRATTTLNRLDLEITNIDTFWNLDGSDVLRYRIDYRIPVKTRRNSTSMETLRNTLEEIIITY